MATTITLNGVGYDIPSLGEDAWGDDVSSYLIATAAGLLSKAGGTFTLTAEIDFGATYGIKSQYIKSPASNIATTGRFRLANADSGIVWRNAANNGDLALTVNSSNALTFNGSAVLAAGLGSIVNADVNAAAAIAYSKLNLASSIVDSDISGSANIAYSKLSLSSSVTSTELGYVSGVTSAIQTQLDAKVAKSSFTAKGDVLVGTGSGTFSALAAGTDGFALVLDSAQSSGVKWASVVSNPMTTSQDIIVGGGSGVPARLAIGSSNTVLRNSGGTLGYGLIVNVNVDAAAAIAGTKISPDFGSQNIATTGVYSAGPTTITTPGYYNVKSTTSFNGLYAESTGTDSNVEAIRFKNDARDWSVSVRGDTSDSFVIRDNTATANRFTIGSTGSTFIQGPVGIGTAAGSVGLLIKGTAANSSNRLTLDSFDNTQNSNAVIQLARSGTEKWFIFNQNSGSADSLNISSATTSAMTITQDGQVNISSAMSSNLGLVVTSTDSAQTSGIVGIVKAASGTTSANAFMTFGVGGVISTSGRIAANGANAAAFFSTSDRRAKKDIATITEGLAIISQLNPVTFKWKQDNSDGRGFIAQEMAQVIPDLVCMTDDGLGEDLPEGITAWSMTESNMIPFLVSAIKELKARVEELEAR